MPIINIDNQTYEIETLSNEAQSQIQMIQLADAEISRLNTQLAMIQTARIAYLRALQQAIDPMPNIL